ncbi:hypothetical protein O3P69_016965 [Scylla paramamosain]|uniref:Uncharacterized protein n=1 Tax=Scylla paramamosain TaxID=85552 RepID=A0AAW0TTX1_SCYPA
MWRHQPGGLYLGGPAVECTRRPTDGDALLLLAQSGGWVKIDQAGKTWELYITPTGLLAEAERGQSDTLKISADHRLSVMRLYNARVTSGGGARYCIRQHFTSPSCRDQVRQVQQRQAARPSTCDARTCLARPSNMTLFQTPAPAAHHPPLFYSILCTAHTRGSGVAVEAVHTDNQRATREKEE